jgi:protein gp37
MNIAKEIEDNMTTEEVLQNWSQKCRLPSDNRPAPFVAQAPKRVHSDTLKNKNIVRQVSARPTGGANDDSRRGREAKMENSKIEWTHHTFNPWVGCTKVSPGCQHCYAETMMAERFGKVEWGPQGVRVRTSRQYWRNPSKWNQKAQKEGHRERVFVASLADVFEDKPDQRAEMDEWRDMLFHYPHLYRNLDWLFLTKRPQNVMAMVNHNWLERGFPPNVWIGTSVENQETADERIPRLLRIPAAVRFLSVEPLLGPVDLWEARYRHDGATGSAFAWGRGVNWVIVGGESGRNARPMNPDWARDIRDACEAAEVPFLFKQWGEWFPRSQWEGNPDLLLPDDDVAYRAGSKTILMECIDGLEPMHKVGAKRAGRALDGIEWNEVPR